MSTEEWIDGRYVTVQQALRQQECDGLPAPHALALRRMAAYVGDFLGSPHPQLGRAGPVCPYVPRSRELDMCLLTLSASCQDEDAVLGQLRRTQQDFMRMQAADGEHAILRAVVTVFPDLPDHEARLVDSIQLRLKPSFVRQGLMIGQFHALNDDEGLHNPEFRPLRSPVPCLAMRSMVETDLPFLWHDDRFLDAYLTRFGRVGTQRLGAALRKAGAKLPPARQERLRGMVAGMIDEGTTP